MTAEERKELDRVLSRRARHIGGGGRVPEDWLRRARHIRARRAECIRRGEPVTDFFDLTAAEALEFMAPMVGGASFFKITLDTTGPKEPTFSIAGGATYVTSQTTVVNFSTTDSSTTGYQVKIWGNVDTAFNANIKATEGESSWIAYSAEVAVKLSSGDGSKTLHAKIRDDVWNETAELSDSITLDTTVPVITISSGPDVTRISKIEGKRTVNIEFQSDTALQAWKVKVVAATGSTESAGTQIGTTNGSTNVTGGALAATTNKKVTIDGRDLEKASEGDGEKIVKVFGQDEAGNWSTA